MMALIVTHVMLLVRAISYFIGTAANTVLGYVKPRDIAWYDEEGSIANDEHNYEFYDSAEVSCHRSDIRGNKAGHLAMKQK